MAGYPAWSRRIVITGLLALAVACSSTEQRRSNPVAPSAASEPATTQQAVPGTDASGPSAAPGASATEGRPVNLPMPGQVGPSDVTFPPRNEPLLFRNALEAQYRDVLRRGSVATFVDQEGTVVWTQEYLRYRVNLCPHSEAVLRVFRQIDGFGVQPICGTTNTVIFPPRNEPFDFMIQLEAKYRDGLRRGSILSFVDIEGNIVWTQEYLRYRVTGCGHADAQSRVFDQIAGRGVPATCGGGGGGNPGTNVFTGTIGALGDQNFLITMGGNGTYQATLTWPDSNIDLDLYLASPSCTTYPPVNCLLTVSDAVGTNFERIQYPVRLNEQYRLWVDNFTDRATNFSVEHFVATGDLVRMLAERSGPVEHGATRGKLKMKSMSR